MNISKTANVMGGQACITGTRIPVYMLDAYMIAGHSDKEILSWYPSLKQSDLDDVRKYVKENGKEIALNLMQSDKY